MKVGLALLLANALCAGSLKLPFALPTVPAAPSAWLQRRSFGATVAAGAGALAAPRVGSCADAPLPGLPPICDQAVSHLVDRANNREIYLIGTAHISNASALLVDATIQAVRPSLVAVELDAGRAKGLGSAPNQPMLTYSGRDLLAGASSGGGPLGLDGSPDGSSAAKAAVPTPAPPAQPAPRGPFGLAVRGLGLDDLGPAVLGKALQQMYRSMDQAGFKSGNEFKVAIDAAARLQVPVLLADQPVGRTLQRLSAALQATDLDRLATPGGAFDRKLKALEQTTPDLAALSSTSLDNPAAVAAVVELIKERQTVAKVMALIRDEVPEVYEAMLGERDRFMAASVNAVAPKGAVVVLVVGIAHADGIERTLVQGAGWALAPLCRGQSVLPPPLLPRSVRAAVPASR